MKIRACFPIVMTGLLFFTLAAPAQVAAKAPASGWRVTWEPSQLVNGSPVLFRVTTPYPYQALHATWFDRQLLFRFDSTCKCWYAIGGVDLKVSPGKYPLRLQAGSNESNSPSFIFGVSVSEKRYPSTAIHVAPKYVQPPPEVEPRIQEEQELKKQLFSRVAPELFWQGPFNAPTVTGISGVFGSTRILNGVKQSPHQGLDFHAAVGTTVRASNRGSVILARNLYFEGNCVVIDHGDGLLTLYMHLSQFRVKEGDMVESGQVLGLSGDTGRVNGPHLHFAVRWQGLYLDPQTLMVLHPPSP